MPEIILFNKNEFTLSFKTTKERREEEMIKEVKWLVDHSSIN